jgi:hypothetical protein
MVEPGLYMLLGFQKAAVRGNYETGSQAFSMRLRFLTVRERIAVEAKEDFSYDLAEACAEMQSARKNRDAAIGVFVFSRKTAPVGQEPLLRPAAPSGVKRDKKYTGNVHLGAM